jgi:NADH dehydrogenase/NADH:ubiquinone oxidoreductase subunit G
LIRNNNNRLKQHKRKVVKKVEGNGNVNGNGVVKKGVLKKGILKKGILKKGDENKTIQEMHKLASQLKNKLHIDENTNYIQNFVPNYDLSDTISGIINNELQKN